MTKKEFVKRITNQRRDLLEEFVKILQAKKIPFCIVGGLAVNAYAEPVVSLDLDVVIDAERLENLLPALSKKFKIKKFPNSINITAPFSDLRIQIQTDPRYQEFVADAVKKDILGYRLPVAKIENVLQGKIWAYQDETRRPSKRQKDLADMMRLLETDANLLSLIPEEIKKRLSL